MRKLIFIFILVSLLIQAKQALGQKLYVAEDFTNCGLGLKDKLTNQWVVQPIYTNIYLEGTYSFKVSLGSRDGILDSTGKMIVPIVYNKIESEHSGGKIYFAVTNNYKQYGIYNYQGKLIVSIKYQHYTIYSFGQVAVSNDYLHWTMYNENGESFELSGKMARGPYEMDDSLLSFRKTPWAVGNWFTGGKKGVMDMHGKILIEPKYEEVNYSHDQYNLLRVTEKDKVIYCTKEGKPIFEGEFDLDFFSYGSVYSSEWSYNNYKQNLSINRNGYIVMRIGGKYGVMGAKGDTIVPFIYEDANPENSYYSRQHLCHFQSVNGWGLFDIQKRAWLIEPEYQKLNIIEEYTNPVDSSLIFLLITKKNNLYGMRTSSGLVIIPEQYGDCNSNGSLGYNFFAGDSSILFTFTKWSTDYYTHFGLFDLGIDSIKQKKYANGITAFYIPGVYADRSLWDKRKIENPAVLNPIYSDSVLINSFFVIWPLHKTAQFADRSSFVAHPKPFIYLTAIENDSVYYYNQGPVIDRNWKQMQKINSDKEHNYYRYNVYDGKKACSILIREDGTKIAKTSGYHSQFTIVQKEPLNWFVINTVNNKRKAIIDGNGKLILDSSWYNISQVNEKYAVVKKKQEKDKLNVVDIETGKTLLTKKEQPESITLLTKNSFVCQYKKGLRLYNIEQKQFVTGFSYMDMEQLDLTGNYFAVKTCLGHIGIIDKNGKLISDTIWHTITQADYAVASLNYYLFYNDTGHICFDYKSGQMVSEDEYKNSLLNAAMSDKQVKFNFSGFCPSLSFDSTLHDSAIVKWATPAVFDTLFLSFRYQADTSYYRPKGFNCDYCAKNQYFTYSWSRDLDSKRQNWLITYQDSHFVSGTCDPGRLSYYHPNRVCDFSANKYINLTNENGIPKIIRLDSLFSGNEWKAFLIEEIMRYLNETPGVQGACSNPYMFPIILKDRFMISAEGLRLFPPNHGFKNIPLEIFIPWEKLEPYLREEVKRKLGVN
jgi:WG containing repeat